MLSTQSIHLLLTDPFFGQLLSALPKQASAAVADAGLAVAGGRMVLLVNEQWAAGGGEDQFDVLRHELLHLVFRHPQECRLAAFPWLFHLAADRVVNSYPDQAGDVWNVYNSLEKSWQEALAAGAPLPWARAIDWRVAGSPLAKHRFWASGVPEAEFRPALMHTDTLVREAGRRAGDMVPGALRLWIQDREGEGQQIDWRRQLRLFSAGSRRTRLRNTIKRPSKRYGTAPGVRLDRGARLLVAVDSSASVGAEVIDLFFQEIHHLWWRQSADIRIVECDVMVRRVYDYRGRRPDFIAGRGGTLFDAPIEFANNQDHPDGLVYFTDGEGPPPQTACRCPLLWVISGGKGGHLPGRRVMIDNS